MITNFLAAARPASPFLQRRAAAEIEQTATVRSLADRTAIIPLLSTELIGETRLADLAEPLTQPA